jgi:hypothetical protein
MIVGRAEVLNAFVPAYDWLAGNPTSLVLVSLILLLFIGWVIRSEHRTQHLVMLIYALRQRTGSVKTRTPGSRRTGGGHV